MKQFYLYRLMFLTIFFLQLQQKNFPKPAWIHTWLKDQINEHLFNETEVKTSLDYI